MPDITTFTDKQLLDQISAGVLSGSQQAAVAELNLRIIKAGDSDDIIDNGAQITRGGIRPHHAPVV